MGAAIWVQPWSRPCTKAHPESNISFHSQKTFLSLPNPRHVRAVWLWLVAPQTSRTAQTTHARTASWSVAAPGAGECSTRGSRGGGVRAEQGGGEGSATS
jgi:hypothetical protein